MLSYRNHAGLRLDAMRRVARIHFHRVAALRPILKSRVGVCWIVR